LHGYSILNEELNDYNIENTVIKNKVPVLINF